MAFTVFLSYSTRDIGLATQARDILVQAGSNVFLAEYSLEPGLPLGDEIIKQIKACDLFILLWSRSSKSSEWVLPEIGVAKGAEKPIVPVVLDKDLELPGFIRDLKYLAFYQDPGRALTWLHQNVFRRVKKKQQTNGLIWLGVGAAVVWLLSERE